MPKREAADARMTADRVETKYVLQAARAKELVALLSRKLPAHHYEGAGANVLPRPQHFVTTIYFDTPSRDLFRTALSSDFHLKLRAKEYYDIHPSLVEVATDPRQIVRAHPVLWLELKHKAGARSGKHRVGIPKSEVPAFFATGHVSAEMLAIQQAIHGADAERVLAEVSALCRRFPEPFRADSLVNYRRIAWQDEAGELRVTLDLNLAFHRPPADLWSRDRALTRETLGPALGSESRCILELKSRAALPSWLRESLGQAGAEPVPFSKFEAASRAIND